MRREHKIISIAQTDAIGVNGPIIIINIFFFFRFFVQLQLNTFLCNHITDFKLGFFVWKEALQASITRMKDCQEAVIWALGELVLKIRDSSITFLGGMGRPPK